jgi:hypothetical protein
MRFSSSFSFRVTMTIISVVGAIGHFNPRHQVLVWVGKFADHKKSGIAALDACPNDEGHRRVFGQRLLLCRTVGKTHPSGRYAVIKPFPVRGDGPNAR